MPSPVSSIIDQIVAVGEDFKANKPGSKEALIRQSRALVAALEIPSEFIQHCFWAQPALSATVRLAVDIKLFQHLKDAGDAGIGSAALSEKTGVETLLLERLTRHLVAMHIVKFQAGAFYGTSLSNALAEENYQHSIAFCYDTARPSFNGFPAFFKENGYKHPTIGGIDGPFQKAHKTDLRFFEWLVATPPNLQHFDSFMTAYRAGKANWYEDGFYPVVDRLIAPFDATISDVLLVDVGGGRGHDMTGFAHQHTSRAGKLILQDREEVVALADKSQERVFDVQAHDFFTPQPIKNARAYFLHSILHDWNDEDGIKILKNLIPALKKGYSKVLLNEIVVSEENPTLAATSMDMMMLAHFVVRERTEAEWTGILEKAGLRIVRIYTYPGVAESLIEAELA